MGDYNLRASTEQYPHEEYSVKRKVVNEAYNPATYQNDIALLELAQDVVYRPHILPICLPPKGILLVRCSLNDDHLSNLIFAAGRNFTGDMATAIGWGRTQYGVSTSPGILQKVEVQVLDSEECQQWMKTAGRREKIFSNMLCAGYKVRCSMMDNTPGLTNSNIVSGRRADVTRVKVTVAHRSACATMVVPCSSDSCLGVSGSVRFDCFDLV